MSVNKVIMIGNLGNDPQIKTFDNGGKVAQFSIATSVRAFTTQDGRQIPERTDWHNVVVRGKMADVAEKYLKKGSKIYLEGELRNRSYTDSNQQAKWITEIFANSFEMLTPKSDQSNQPESAKEEPKQTFTDNDDDLPF